jgi:Amt family ammonium transporter
VRALATNTTHRVMPTAALAGLLLFAIPASADTGATVLTPEEVRFWVNNTWMLVATFFVFLMHLGFATL